MEAPDTVLELHRDVVIRQARGVYEGGSYSEPYEGNYTERGTATVTIELERVWFVLDRHERAWLEDGSEPLRHFAIDLGILDYADGDVQSSRISIDSLAGVPLPLLPPRTVTIPNGPRAGETAVIPVNVIPLYGTLTLHDQVARRDVTPSSHMLGIDFRAQPAPQLLAPATSDPLASTLFGADAVRGINGTVAFGVSTHVSRGTSTTPSSTGSRTAFSASC